MADLHAWDCRCGRRSAPGAAFCQHCGNPQSSGTPIAAGPPLPDIEIPRPQPWGTILFLVCVLAFIVFYIFNPGGAALGVLGLLYIFAAVPWWTWIVFIIIGLLARIAVAVERIGR